jgi:hypothetical protein
LQSRIDNIEFCRTWAEEIQLAEQQQAEASAELSNAVPGAGREHAAWQAIRCGETLLTRIPLPSHDLALQA